MQAPPAADLRHYIRVYDGALAPELCRQLLALWQSNAAAQQANGASVRQALADSAWTELDLAAAGDPVLPELLARQIEPAYRRYVADIGLRLPPSPPQRTEAWIVKRYRPGGAERFQPHYDAVGPVAGRYLVLLWYLNDVAEGGATRFTELDLEVEPRCGRLLMFPPYWMYAHAGLAPRSADKYILSTYLSY